MAHPGPPPSRNRPWNGWEFLAATLQPTPGVLFSVPAGGAAPAGTAARLPACSSSTWRTTTRRSATGPRRCAVSPSPRAPPPRPAGRLTPHRELRCAAAIAGRGEPGRLGAVPYHRGPVRVPERENRRAGRRAYGRHHPDLRRVKGAHLRASGPADVTPRRVHPDAAARAARSGARVPAAASSRRASTWQRSASSAGSSTSKSWPSRAVCRSRRSRSAAPA